jgi:hypothetical protein
MAIRPCKFRALVAEFSLKLSASRKPKWLENCFDY